MEDKNDKKCYNCRKERGANILLSKNSELIKMKF